jgi:hypothetical protein
LNLLVSNGIIFILYNLYFIGQISNLSIRVGPLNRNGGSSQITPSTPVVWVEGNGNRNSFDYDIILQGNNDKTKSIKS